MIRSSLLAAVGVVAIATAATAQPLPTTRIAAGTIVSADAATRTISIKTGDHTQAYTLAEDAKLESGKAKVETADLAAAEGQRVTIWYTTSGESRLAGRVKLDKSKGTATAKAATSGAPATTPQ